MIYQFKTFNVSEAKSAMKDWIDNGCAVSRLDNDYLKVSQDIESLYEKAKKKTIEYSNRKEYFLDITFGVELYTYLHNQPWFNLRTASDNGFWRYLSIVILPNLVAERWGRDNEDHFWRKPTRIWLRTIWWYIHLSWKNDSNETFKMLSSEMFDTDVILNLVERSGRKGTNIAVYRSIVEHYGNQSLQNIRNYKHGKGKTLFRAVMCLNTTRSIVVEPELYSGGVDGYVKGLFKALNIDGVA